MHILELLVYLFCYLRLALLLLNRLLFDFDHFLRVILRYLDLFIFWLFVVDKVLEVVFRDRVLWFADTEEHVSGWLAALLLLRLVEFDYFDLASSLDFSLLNSLIGGWRWLLCDRWLRLRRCRLLGCKLFAKVIHYEIGQRLCLFLAVY